MTQKLFFSILFICFIQPIYGQAFNMTLEGSWDNTSYEFNDCWGYTDGMGNEYAIMGSKTKVIFFDVTSPTSPTLIAEFTGSFSGISGANSIWRDFKTYDRYAYAVADQGSEGLMVFDLSDIHNGNISKVYQKNDKFTRAHNIFIDVPEGKLYIIGSNSQSDGLIVYDLAENPSEPEHLSSVAVAGGYIHDAYVYDNIVYGSSGWDGLFIIDMTIPTNPVFKSFDQTTAAGYNHSGWPFDNGDKMIVAEEVPTGLKLAIYDISDLDDIDHISSFRDPVNTSGSGFPTYHNPYMLEDYAVISSYEDGITIMDLSNTNTPFRAAHYDTYTNTNYTGYEGCWGAYPYFPSGTIIGSDINTGLYVLSTSLTLNNTCANGVQDDFEVDIDCGGFCNTCDCSSPLDIVFTDQATGTIKIDWTAVSTATEYEVRYKKSDTNNWTVVNSSTNTITITGLLANTDYDFQIRSDCGNRLTPYGTSMTYTTGECLNSEVAKTIHGSITLSSQDYIVSNATIIPNSTVEYLTGDSIMLEESFNVEANTDFLAETSRPCGIPAFTGQAEILKYTNLEPPVPSDPFTLSMQKGAGIFYVIANRLHVNPYTVEILDINGTVIGSSNQSIRNMFIKFQQIDKQHSIRITEGDSIFNILLDQ